MALLCESQTPHNTHLTLLYQTQPIQVIHHRCELNPQANIDSFPTGRPPTSPTSSDLSHSYDSPAAENFRSGSGQTSFALSLRYLPLRVGGVMRADNSNLNEEEQDFIIRTICPLFLTLLVSR
jgi:hypothetical protein